MVSHSAQISAVYSPFKTMANEMALQHLLEISKDAQPHIHRDPFLQSLSYTGEGTDAA